MMSQNPDEFLPTRQTLLSRLRDWDDKESWREFFNTYWRFIYSMCLKAGLTETEAQDVVQQAVLIVAKQMPGFQYDAGRGSFKAWLVNITRSRIVDHLRRRPPWAAEQRPCGSNDSTSRTPTLERVADPKPFRAEESWDEAWQQNLLAVAMEKVKGQVRPKHYQIFDLAVNRGWPVRDVVRALEISAPQVYLVKHRLTKLLKQEIRRLEERMERGR
jgi:RNA polymerase sigma-70 factor (ECF subfamily)